MPLLLVCALLAWACWPGNAPGQQHAIPEYSAALRLFWNELYPDGGRTLYCDEAFARDSGGRINVEHVLPMAWAMNALDCESRDLCRERSERFNRMEADLHNLYPARRDVNEARGSFGYDELRDAAAPFPGCDFDIDHRRRRVEPRPAARGEIARAMFYMHESYQLEIFTRLGITLKRWNREDPPTAEERRRNDLIEMLQGTRNRFIDDPQAAEALWF